MSETEAEKLTLVFKKKIFQNPSNYYLIGLFEDEETNEEIVCCGTMDPAALSQTLCLSGKFVNHPKYGRQFQFKDYEVILPDGKDALISFLSSDRFEGIGKKTAEKIWNELGDNALDQILEDPSILEKRLNFSASKAQMIQEGLQDLKGTSSVVVWLIKLGLNQSQITKLLSSYSNVEKILKENPFHPFYHVFGFGYEAAMLLADGLKIPAADPRRFDAYVYEKIREYIFNTGSTYLDTGRFHYSLEQDLKRKITVEEISRALQHLLEEGVIGKEENRIYPMSLLEDEKSIAAHLAVHFFPVEKLDPEEIDEAIGKLEESLRIQYDETQKEAIHTFFDSSIMILNGGPGTGKSTTVNGILKLIDHFYPQSVVQLCAPTGRASKRLMEISSRKARTIHSLLKWNLENDSFSADEDEISGIDFLIVDETSMVDTHVFASLLSLLHPNCRILLIGDEDQLEPVSPGRTFMDLVEMQPFPVVTLKTLFRQAKGSGISVLAEEIRNQQPLRFENGVSFEEMNPELITDRIARAFLQAENPEELQVLAPRYRGVAGIDAINLQIQELLNPFSPAKKQIRKGKITFREGDRVLLKKNMAEQNVYNGDIGVISKILDGKSLEVRFDEDVVVVFEGDDLFNLSHAWCISVHKSQGTEYQNVIVVCDRPSQFMLYRRLLYTGISRAKKSLLILGDRETFATGVKQKQLHIRETTLKPRLKKALLLSGSRKN